MTMESKEELKARVQAFWDSGPCGTKWIEENEDLPAYFDEIERHRYEAEPFIKDFARFGAWEGKRVLEVGCGAGTDHMQFARRGARIFGVDLSRQSVNMTRARIHLEGYSPRLSNTDAENLPFPDDSFDYVYSWGVIHHTPETPRTVAEIHRVLKPGGRICIMVYHKTSWVVFLIYLRWGLFAGRPFRSLDDLVAHHMESEGTKAYTRSEGRRLFGAFEDLTLDTVLTPWDDLRYHMSGPVQKLWSVWARMWGHRFGWFLVARGGKAG